jgi:nucleotide-binding universal stress UspA family protein
MKGNAMATYKHILVPTDGSKLSLKAAKEAAELARTLKAKLTALYVVAPYMPALNGEGAILVNYAYDQRAYKAASEKNAAAALAGVASAAAEAKVPCKGLHITDPQPWEGIIRTAKRAKCDLIVMASHGRRGLSGLLLGSETHKVLTHSKTPVLVCR